MIKLCIIQEQKGANHFRQYIATDVHTAECVVKNELQSECQKLAILKGYYLQDLVDPRESVLVPSPLYPNKFMSPSKHPQHEWTQK